MPDNRTLLRWILVELIGTAILTMSVAVMVTQSSSSLPNAAFYSLFVPFGVGLTLFIIVALLSKMGSVHVNPAVTLGHLLFRRITPHQAGIYIVSQIVGAFAGIGLAHLLLSSTHLMPTATVTTPGVLGEFIGTFLLAFAVMSVTLKRVEMMWGPWVIGGSLALGITLAIGQGAGLLNPAIALAMGAYGWTYLLMPILGGLSGSALAVILDEESDSRAR
jgi:glycerol uptake facilitator-like aquaporin